VALVLGVGILTATIAMQIQYRDGFRLTSNQLEMQTNAKFAFEFISKNLRSLGSMGCKSGMLYVDDSAVNTTVTAESACYSKLCIAFNDPQVAFADFRPGYEVLGYEYVGTGLVPSPPTAFMFVALNQFNANSDMLTLAGAFGEVYRVQDGYGIRAVDSGVQLDMTNVGKVRLDQFQYGVLSSCQGAFIFQVTSSEASIGLGNIQWAGGAAADGNKTGQAGVEVERTVRGGNNREFRRAAITTFFVGMTPLNDANGVPTLYMDVDGVTSPLVEGVEELQILYGISENPTKINIADRYVTAETINNESDFAATPQVNKWERVVSVRIGIIMRSAEQVFDVPTIQNPPVGLACIDNYIQTPAKSDRFSRSTYCAEVSLRNRLTGVRVGSRI